MSGMFASLRMSIVCSRRRNAVEAPQFRISSIPSSAIFTVRCTKGTVPKFDKVQGLTADNSLPHVESGNNRTQYEYDFVTDCLSNSIFTSGERQQTTALS